MRNDYYSNSNDYINRWVISYADFVTMLLALFMVMFATSSMGDLKVKDVKILYKRYLPLQILKPKIQKQKMLRMLRRKKHRKVSLIIPEKLY